MTATTTNERTVRELRSDRGKVVRTPFTHEEALTIVKTLTTDFARDLVKKQSRYGLSHNQWVWVHVLAVDATQPQQEPVTVNLGDFAPIAALFDKAGRHLQHPKVRLQTTDGRPVVLSVAGPHSKHPGSIHVTDGGRYGQNSYFGRIDQDGQFTPYRDCTGAVKELLARFAADPAGVASEYGRLTGSCCFCQSQLTDERSTAVGYGETCSRHYGLPYPTRAQARAMHPLAVA